LSGDCGSAGSDLRRWRWSWAGRRRGRQRRVRGRSRHGRPPGPIDLGDEVQVLGTGSRRGRHSVLLDGQRFTTSWWDRVRLSDTRTAASPGSVRSDEGSLAGFVQGPPRSSSRPSSGEVSDVAIPGPRLQSRRLAASPAGRPLTPNGAPTSQASSPASAVLEQGAADAVTQRRLRLPAKARSAMPVLSPLPLGLSRTSRGDLGMPRCVRQNDLQL
jgi:hypothetical protein